MRASTTILAPMAGPVMWRPISAAAVRAMLIATAVGLGLSPPRVMAHPSFVVRTPIVIFVEIRRMYVSMKQQYSREVVIRLGVSSGLAFHTQILLVGHLGAHSGLVPAQIGPDIASLIPFQINLFAGRRSFAQGLKQGLRMSVAAKLDLIIRRRRLFVNRGRFAALMPV